MDAYNSFEFVYIEDIPAGMVSVLSVVMCYGSFNVN